MMLLPLVLALLCWFCGVPTEQHMDLRPGKIRPFATVQATRISPDSMALNVGETSVATCLPKNNKGVTLANACAWKSLDTTIAKLTVSDSQHAFVKAMKIGRTGVRAGSGGKADTMWVTVTDTTTKPPVDTTTPPPVDSSCAGMLRAVNVATTNELLTAVNNVLPGDCITLSAGTYALSFTVDMTRGGTADHPVVFRGQGPGSTIIQGTSNIAWQFKTGGDYIQFWNLRFTNFYYGPIANPTPFTTTGGKYLVFDNVEVDHNQQQGIAAYNGANNGIIRRSYIHHTGLAGAGSCGPGQFGEGVYIGGGTGGLVDNWQILNTRFDNFTAEAIDINGFGSGHVLDGNTMDGSQARYYPNCTTSLIANYADNVIIRNNVLTYGDPHGIVLYAGSGTQVRGNTIHLFNLHNAGGIGVYTKGHGTVYCDNVVTDIPPGGSAYDVSCVP